jgi:elongation factor P hydroxylase
MKMTAKSNKEPKPIRQWLNDDETMQGHHIVNFVEGDWLIADCARRIYLDFSVWQIKPADRKRQAKQQIKKIKKIRAAADKIIEHLEKC